MRGRRGFAALELLIAIAVGALIVALAIPALERYQRLRDLRQSGRQLLAAVRLAQQQAATLDEDVRLVYTAGPPPRYAIERLDGTGLYRSELPSGLMLSGSYAAVPLQFRPSGAPVAPGEFCLTEGTQWLRLDVSAGTGRAQLEEAASCP
jgi:prepilin-type N-terminal cleavage/methylation domain-containing protein